MLNQEAAPKVHHQSSPRAGISIKTAPHDANAYELKAYAATSPKDLLKGACHQEHTKCKELIQSSLHLNEHSSVHPSSNGFVRGAIAAYNGHHHFTIRPDDVWFAILTQFSYFVNAHAEELRSQFVAHEGQKELEVTFTSGNRYTVDFGWFARTMTGLIDKNVLDPELRGWIMPNFSTTTENDTTVAAILMMGTMQAYFSFTCCILCGIPSVTLLGEKADWENILHRLEKLKQYGKECTRWYGLLRAVLLRFIKTFDEPHSEDTKSFWQRICHTYSMGSGTTYLSGWITAFCFWDDKGKMLWQEPENPSSNDQETQPRSRLVRKPDGTRVFEPQEWPSHEKGWNDQCYPYLNFDGAAFHRLDMGDIPAGYGSVPVKVDDNGYEFQAMMVAGSVGIEASSSGQPMANGEVGIDSLQPVSGWWMFQKHED